MNSSTTAPINLNSKYMKNNATFIKKTFIKKYNYESLSMFAITKL